MTAGGGGQGDFDNVQIGADFLLGLLPLLTDPLTTVFIEQPLAKPVGLLKIFIILVMQKLGCQKPCWDQARLSSLVNKQVD